MSLVTFSPVSKQHAARLNHNGIRCCTIKIHPHQHAGIPMVCQHMIYVDTGTIWAGWINKHGRSWSLSAGCFCLTGHPPGLSDVKELISLPFPSTNHFTQTRPWYASARRGPPHGPACRRKTACLKNGPVGVLRFLSAVCSGSGTCLPRHATVQRAEFSAGWNPKFSENILEDSCAVNDPFFLYSFVKPFDEYRTESCYIHASERFWDLESCYSTEEKAVQT